MLLRAPERINYKKISNMGIIKKLSKSGYINQNAGDKRVRDAEKHLIEIDQYLHNIDQQLDGIDQSMSNALLAICEALMNGITPQSVDSIPEELSSYSTTAIEIPSTGAKPGVKYILGYVGGGGEADGITVEDTALDVTLEPTDGLEEYFFDFKTYSTYQVLETPNISFPSSVQWVSEPEFESGMHYQVSIVNNIGSVVAVEDDDPTEEPYTEVEGDDSNVEK